MRYLNLGVLACLCSGLAWAEVDTASVKSKAQHAHAAKDSPSASYKRPPAELANLATEKEIAQRRAALAASAAAARAAAFPFTPASLDAAVPTPVAQASVAGNVHVGQMVCELGNTVSVTPDTSEPGRFWVQMRQHRYHMSPIATSTGAVRLEDVHAGAMWLQLPMKSMLMNSKLGQRMADECQSTRQLEVANRMKLSTP